MFREPQRFPPPDLPVLSLSLENYAEFYTGLVKQGTKVLPSVGLDENKYKRTDLQQILALHLLSASGRNKKELLERMVNLELYRPFRSTVDSNASVEIESAPMLNMREVRDDLDALGWLDGDCLAKLERTEVPALSSKTFREPPLSVVSTCEEGLDKQCSKYHGNDCSSHHGLPQHQGEPVGKDEHSLLTQYQQQPGHSSVQRGSHESQILEFGKGSIVKPDGDPKFEKLSPLQNDTNEHGRVSCQKLQKKINHPASDVENVMNEGTSQLNGIHSGRAMEDSLKKPFSVVSNSMGQDNLKCSVLDGTASVQEAFSVNTAKEAGNSFFLASYKVKPFNSLNECEAASSREIPTTCNGEQRTATSTKLVDAIDARNDESAESPFLSKRKLMNMYDQRGCSSLAAELGLDTLEGQLFMRQVYTVAFLEGAQCMMEQTGCSLNSNVQRSLAERVGLTYEQVVTWFQQRSHSARSAPRIFRDKDAMLPLSTMFTVVDNSDSLEPSNVVIQDENICKERLDTQLNFEKRTNAGKEQRLKSGVNAQQKIAGDAKKQIPVPESKAGLSNPNGVKERMSVADLLKHMTTQKVTGTITESKQNSGGKCGNEINGSSSTLHMQLHKLQSPSSQESRHDSFEKNQLNPTNADCKTATVEQQQTKALNNRSNILIPDSLATNYRVTKESVTEENSNTSISLQMDTSCKSSSGEVVQTSLNQNFNSHVHSCETEEDGLRSDIAEPESTCMNIGTILEDQTATVEQQQTKAFNDRSNILIPDSLATNYRVTKESVTEENSNTSLSLQMDTSCKSSSDEVVQTSLNQNFNSHVHSCETEEDGLRSDIAEPESNCMNIGTILEDLKIYSEIVLPESEVTRKDKLGCKIAGVLLEDFEVDTSGFARACKLQAGIHIGTVIEATGSPHDPDFCTPNCQDPHEIFFVRFPASSSNVMAHDACIDMKVDLHNRYRLNSWESLKLKAESDPETLPEAWVLLSLQNVPLQFKPLTSRARCRVLGKKLLVTSSAQDGNHGQHLQGLIGSIVWVTQRSTLWPAQVVDPVSLSDIEWKQITFPKEKAIDLLVVRLFGDFRSITVVSMNKVKRFEEHLSFSKWERRSSSFKTAVIQAISAAGLEVPVSLSQSDEAPSSGKGLHRSRRKRKKVERAL